MAGTFGNALFKKQLRILKQDFIQAILSVLILALLMSGFWGCAFEEVERKPGKPVNTVWPLPPAEPKIKFVEIIESKDDLQPGTKSGWLKNFIGGEEDIENRLRRPYGVAIDRDGRIYVADVGRVFVFDKKNNSLSFIGDRVGTGQLKMPIGVAVAPDGKVYVSDVTSKRIFIYNRSGEFIKAIGHAGELKNPSGIAVDSAKDRLYVADTRINSVRAYTLDGRFLFAIEGLEADKGKLSFPTNIAVDSHGNIYVVDTGNFRVQVYNSEGKFLKTISGSKPKSFVRPKGIAIDSEGNMYVVDAALQKIFIFDKEGNFFLEVGEAGMEPGQFSMPAGIAADAEDRIYVVDQLNARVQVFQYLGEKWKKKQTK